MKRTKKATQEYLKSTDGLFASKMNKKEQLIKLLMLGVELDRKLTTALALGQESTVENLYCLLAENSKAIAALKGGRK